MQRDVFHFKTVDVPYEVARRFMRDDPERLFSPALEGHAAHDGEVSGLLEVDLDGLIFGADVTLEIGDFTEVVEPLPLSRRTIGWHAAEHAGLFPILGGELEVFPVGDRKTQVTFTCHYRPPLKTVGAIADVVYLHRVAEECLDRFFERLIESLEQLSAQPRS